ncbi:hypothetical protein Q3G72_014800 [Acer saccharum]|nr:hypothetical protein Q3G72_014800 [Acer saccharum]
MGRAWHDPTNSRPGQGLATKQAQAQPTKLLKSAKTPWDVETCPNSSLKDWFMGWAGLSRSSKSNRAWNTLFFALTWTIWEARNQKVFHDTLISVANAADMLKFRLALWFKHHGKGSSLPVSTMMLNIKESCSDPKPVKKRVGVAWSPPIGSALKFNVDGSARGNPGNAGVGGVLRDNSGKVLGLFSASVGMLDSNSAELLAIHKAVSLCTMSVYLHGVEIEIVSDSFVVVDWVNSSGVGCLEHVNTIFDIRNALANLGNTRVIFNPRSSNTFADALSKNGSALKEDRLIWGVS